MNRPHIVFGDEPTGNLDSTSATEVLGFLRRSVDEFGQTVVMVTHDAHAASYADRAVFLSDGHIVHEMRGATQEDLLGAMSHIYPRHTPTHGAPDPVGDQSAAITGAADGAAVYRDGGAAPSFQSPDPDDAGESTLERSIARRASLDS